jgi:hypothetical protein
MIGNDACGNRSVRHGRTSDYIEAPMTSHVECVAILEPGAKGV